MAQRIETYYQVDDARAKNLQKKLQNDGFQITKIDIVDAYTLDFQLTAESLQKCGQMLINPVVQNFNLNSFYSPKLFDWVLEVGFLAGVTDNVAQTTRQSIEDLLKIKLADSEHVYSSQIIYLKGSITDKDVKNLSQSLVNPLIQRQQIKSFEQFTQDEGLDIVVPRVKLEENSQVEQISLEVSDEQLENLSKSRTLALSLKYLKTIQAYFRKLARSPTDIELESLAQTWSEHCKHTIFADPLDEIKDGLFRSYIKKATEVIRKQRSGEDFCASVFVDNSGAVKFDEEFLITDKVETHNSPSALDPYGGAITGIIGVNRDTLGFGLGAKPIANRFGFCFADPSDNKPLYRDLEKKQQLLEPRRVLNGVVKGINSGGNCSGIPTPQGFMIFDQSYKGKPLVFAGTVGLIPGKFMTKKALNNDLIVMIGGRVGKDGIHGATFSSESLSGNSPSTAVQIGDPITQKKFSDALIKEARNLNLYHSITDNGAGGLSCSVAEMAKESGGCEVNLEKVPLKYPGLKPWEIWVSESQERMTLAIPTKNWPKFQELMQKRGVEATVIGKFTNSGFCQVFYNDDSIMNIDLDFLHNGLPKNPKTSKFSPKSYPNPKIARKQNYNLILKDILKINNLASKEFLFLQYDHEVQAGSVTKPLQGAGRVEGCASCIRPILSKSKAVLLSQALLPWYGLIDSYHMASCTIDLAVRNALAGGASLQKLALLDNFCWCSSTEPERLGQLKQAAKACFDYSVFYGTPFISGKDSMFNDFNGFDQNAKSIKISALPTLLISTVGVIDDIYKSITIDVKIPGDLVYVLGDTLPELGASEYFSYLGAIGKTVPQVDANKNKRLYQSFCQASSKQLIASAISIGRGGLAVGFAKMAIAANLGLKLDLGKPAEFCKQNYEILFSESTGRFAVTVDPQKQTKFEKIMSACPIFLVGKVTKTPKLVISKNNKLIINSKLAELEKSYKQTFKNS